MLGVPSLDLVRTRRTVQSGANHENRSSHTRDNAAYRNRPGRTLFVSNWRRAELTGQKMCRGRSIGPDGPARGGSGGTALQNRLVSRQCGRTHIKRRTTFHAHISRLGRSCSPYLHFMFAGESFGVARTRDDQPRAYWTVIGLQAVVFAVLTDSIAMWRPAPKRTKYTKTTSRP